jgi:CheY-like chemotaxis protein
MSKRGQFRLFAAPIGTSLNNCLPPRSFSEISFAIIIKDMVKSIQRAFVFSTYRAFRPSSALSLLRFGHQLVPLPSTGQTIPQRGAPLLKVLIAEDELLIADLMEDTLTANGYEVCGIARTVDEAVALGELHQPDLAVLDVRLARGGYGPDIGQRLKSKAKLGVLYATGTDARDSGLTMADGEALIAKPYRNEDLLRALVIVWEIVTAGTATRPFPRGFHLLPKSAAPRNQAVPA